MTNTDFEPFDRRAHYEVAGLKHEGYWDCSHCKHYVDDGCAYQNECVEDETGGSCFERREE